MPSSEPHPSQYHLQHHNIPPSHLQQHSSNAIGQHQLYQQLVAAHHQQQHGGPFQNSTYAQQKQEMSPEEEGGRGGGSPPTAGAALHPPHHPRTASPPSGSEPCTRDAIPTPTPIVDTTTTTTTAIPIQSQGQQQTQQGSSPSQSPTGGDVEKFDGKIVYNPDGSAYIIEGESELSEDDSLPDGCIVDGRGVSVPHSLVFPQIASAYYVSRLYAHQAYQQQQQQQQRTSATQHNPDLPVMHSYRVISYRSAEGSKQPPPQPVAPPSPAASVPVKPILMCFICKLSFGYAKSFVAHAQGEHQLTLMEDERQILSHSTASAILQAVGRSKQPLVSFLEPVTSSTCSTTSPGQTQGQQQQRSEGSEIDIPTTTSTPASTPGVPSSPLQQQHRPSPSTPTTPTSHTNHPLTYNHHQWPAAQVSAASWAKAPDAAMHYTSPPPSASTKSSPSSYAALTQQPPNFLTGTTIGVCPEHMQGRPSGVECPKCELILASSRLAGPGGPLAGIHSRNSCKTLKCPKCNWHYKYQETLEIHMKEKHPESETSCIYCIAGQPHPRLARGETYTCGYKPYRCEVCNYSTTTKGNLSIHMQSDKHLNNMQEIQQGGGAASSASTNPSSSQDAPLPTRSPHHQQNHSPHLGCQTATQGKPKPTFRCDVCNYETSVARNLRIHMTSEKHTHNMLVLQQNVKQMHALSALQSHHQQAQQHHHQQAQQQHQQQLEQLIHLGGLDKPQHAEAALADMAYNQALLIQMMTGGQLPPQLPPELMGGMANMNVIGNLGGDVGLSPDSMEPPPEPADPDPTHLYHCCVCNNFATDSLEALGQHLAADRTRTREGEILALVAGHFVCKLCSYKTNLKANFQLHCKTDKHLQRLQHVNHVKEGGPRNEWKLKYLASPTSAAQLRCHACDYYTNSAHKLALHAASPRHEAAALLLRHLLEASSNVPSAAKLYHCALCMFSARHRLPLLQHVRSLRHLQMEQMHQIHRRNSIQGNETPHTDIGDVFQVVPDPDVPSTQQSSPTTPTTPNAANTSNERREEGSESGSEVKQEPDNEPEQDQEPEADSDEISCPYCTYQPTSREELRQHMQIAHVQDTEDKAENVKEEPTPDLLCPLCQDGFKERTSLEKHVMQIHSVNADGLQRLLLLVDQSHWLNNNPRNTSTPAAAPNSPGNMTKQPEEEHNEQAPSEEVDETTRCTICGRVCRSLEELQQHHRETHPATTPTLAVSEKHVYKYRCGQCSLAFKTLEKLQQHSQYHAIRDATKCALCGRCFRSVQALQRHLESAHSDLQEDELAQYKQSLLHAHPLLQALTEEALRRQSGMIAEQNMEEETRGDEEESDASDSSPLHKEQRLLEDYLNSQPVAEDSYHDPGRKFKCHRCKVAFTRQSYLTGHNKTLLHRKGEKMSYPMEKYLDPNRPYKCDVCKESFTQKNILLVHYNSVSHLHKLKRAMQEQGNNNTLISVVPPASPTESAETQQDQDKKPYKCNICKVAYSQGSTLDIHMRSVLHQTRAGKLQDLAASGQVDLGRPLIEQPPPTSPNSPPSNTNTSGNNMLSCSRCSALFINQEQLATHQQLYCIFSNPLALFQQLAASQQMGTPSKTPPPTSSAPQMIQQATSQQASQTQDILSQPRHKTSQMYKHLLESFGFDLVMQFNENHQRRQRKEEEAAAALQAQQEQQKQEQQKQALAAQAAQEKEEETEDHAEDEVIPELTRSTCQHCNKAFSSVWVLKAHCEEVHRDLVPREFLEKYAQQFKCEYEKKSVVVTAATSSSTTTTAPRSTTPVVHQPQDLTSDKEHRNKDKVELPDSKENISRTPEATSTTPATTPALSNTPVSSTDSGTPTASNPHHMNQQQHQQQQQQQHAQLTLAQQMSEMQAALNAMAASQLQQHLQQYPGLMMGMMGLPLGLNVPALAAMNLQPPLVPMMLPPPPYDGAANAYPPINSQADLLAKQHLALQQQQAAVANAAASQKRARTRITDDQLKILRAHFDINNSPGEEQILDMAAQSGLPPKVIKHWFRNTLFKERQRNKDSPYNFNNPPSTTLNLEEYEKTGEAKVTPLNSSVSGSSSDDKSPNKQTSPPPSLPTIITPQLPEIKQELPDPIQFLQQHQSEEHQQHHSPGSSGGQQSRPHSPALSMSSVFSGLHHDISTHCPSVTSAPSTPMLPPKVTPQNFATQSPGSVVNIVPSSIAAMALTPQRSISPGRGPADYSFGGNSNGSNSSGGSSGKRANRTRFTDYQIKVLQEFFENNAYPKDDDLEYLSKLLGLSPRVIVVWFQNARQKARKVYENQPAAEPVTPGGREGDDGSGRFQRTPGLNYQCKKCLLVFQRYYELIRHQKTHCFKEEDAKRSAQAQAAAAQVAAVLSSEDSNSSTATTTNTGTNNPSTTPALTEQLQQPMKISTPPHQQQQQQQPQQQQQNSSQQQQSQPQSESKEGSFQCDKCNLMFGRFELWREHQLVHIMNPSLFPPAYPPDSPFGILQQQALNATTGVSSEAPHPLIAMMQDGKRKFDEFDDGASENRSSAEHNEQPKDKRLRTTILPEQLDYLYQKYQVESNPSRKMLETIAREVGLKKRVVQVWFQNTRARERKGQFRAHSQVINKRCPFCPALFKVKSALESHLSSKHADQVARGEVNIDNIPDEELSMESAPSNPSTPNMMPPLFPPFNSEMEASLKKYYEESMKRYISELQAHTRNGKQESGSNPPTGNSGESPLDLSKPVDLSRPVKLSLGGLSSLLEEQHVLNLRGGSDCGPLTDLSERSICDDDSMSETTEFLDDESGPASPASSTQSSRQGAQSGGNMTSGGLSVSGSGGGQSGGKRYRTQMSATQVKVMKSLFSDYKTPTMAECEMLGREIGLPKRVVQVWFQNARAKEKKARLAAGLPAEGSAVQPHRGPTGPDECRLCSVRYSPKSPLQEHVFSRRHIEAVRVAVEDGSLVPPTPGAPILPGGVTAGPTAANQPSNQQQQQQDENMMYGSLFLHPTAMFQQQQHTSSAAASTATTTAAASGLSGSVTSGGLMSLQVEGGTQVQVPRSLMQAFLQQDPNHPGLETVSLSSSSSSSGNGDDQLPPHCREIESELCLVCRRCGRAYPQESTLLAHQRSCYLGNQQRRGALRLVQPRYACSLCDSGTSTRTYGTITELRRHLETVQHRTRLEATNNHQIGKQSLLQQQQQQQQQQKSLQLDNILNAANLQSGEEANPLIDEMEDVVNQITLLAARAAAESTTGQQTNGNQDNNNGPDSKRQKLVQEVAPVAEAR
ncbi:zinc finger homeobox protein 4 isoform X2 [Leptopilina heterotoma]|uniref:zinc finger homeobox protein 4 isoform X2 n=1 Tax=Leptopilina heterotoma TaxID=63436 RepID=UPI001CA906E7|nr:zinc finger homeobox protein 4 isoform X2 [Leptopilina heterotoma]